MTRSEHPSWCLVAFGHGNYAVMTGTEDLLRQEEDGGLTFAVLKDDWRERAGMWVWEGKLGSTAYPSDNPGTWRPAKVADLLPLADGESLHEIVGGLSDLVEPLREAAHGLEPDATDIALREFQRILKLMGGQS